MLSDPCSHSAAATATATASASPARLQQQQPSHASGAAPLTKSSSPAAAAQVSVAGDLDEELHEPMSDEDASPTSAKRTRKACEEPASPPRRKRVRWSTITVHEFGIGLGGSSISERGGPSIGLADKPEFTWTTKVGEMAECSEGIHRFTPDQRTRLLKAVGVSDGIISRYARETSIILKSRRKTIAEGVDEISSEEEDEEEEDEEETEDEDSEDDLDMYSRKRKASSQHSIYIGHPQFTPLRRPRMIPANYV